MTLTPTAPATNDPAYIRELQSYLRTIAGYRNDIPSIGVDGIYGQQTTMAVSAFQHSEGLPITGITDRETWDAVFAAYTAVRFQLSAGEPVHLFPQDKTYLQRGDSGDVVYMLQLILERVSQRFRNLPPVPLTGRYDADTERAVAAFQACCLFAVESGKTDKHTWKHLVRLYQQL